VHANNVHGSDIFEAILRELGAPHTEVNLTALDLWARSEGMPAGDNNPFATTQDGYGGVAVNSVGVKRYPTVNDGAAATVHTMRNGHYQAVLEAIAHGTDLHAIYRAINESPWCGGCQHGHYPIAIYEHLAASAGDGHKHPDQPAHDGARVEITASLPVLRAGDASHGASMVQGLLSASGHHTAVTGTLDAHTVEMVKAFQRSHSLGDDGIVGKRTWRALLGQHVG
jgi:peptidoglycan hydrolase-like protein with peptidoglycan-binding domain